MIIDIYSHYIPPKFLDAFSKRVGPAGLLAGRATQNYDMRRVNLDARLKVMDKFGEYVQVLTPTGHSLERYASPADAEYLAKIYNDELAELVAKYSDRFIAAVGVLPLNSVDATLRELERTIKEMGFKGAHLHTPIVDKPLDSPEYMPIYELMVKYDLPIWIHPTRHHTQPDYPGEKEALYLSYQAFGWPYETTLAMMRLVCSGTMAKFPTIKFITHHAGAMIPFFAGRLPMLEYPFYNKLGGDSGAPVPIDHFKRFYNDTALYGVPSALMCSHAFFGTEHLLYGSDLPYGPGLGEQYIRTSVDAVNAMDISAADKKKIFEGNARKLLKLSD